MVEGFCLLSNNIKHNRRKSPLDVIAQFNAICLSVSQDYSPVYLVKKKLKRQKRFQKATIYRFNKKVSHCYGHSQTLFLNEHL